MLIHRSLRFDFLFGFDLAEIVRRYTVHQNADGGVAVVVEASGPVSSRQVARLRRELDDLLEGYPVTLEFVGELPQATRKHRWTTSDLSAPADAHERREIPPVGAT